MTRKRNTRPLGGNRLELLRETTQNAIARLEEQRKEEAIKYVGLLFKELFKDCLEQASAAEWTCTFSIAYIKNRIAEEQRWVIGDAEIPLLVANFEDEGIPATYFPGGTHDEANIFVTWATTPNEGGK